MRFELKTLVDITETGARRGEDAHLYNQQQNFLILCQTISLRANPIINKKPTVEKQNIGNLGFGKKHQGVHNVWTLTFDFESENQHSVEFLQHDVELVPVIIDLDETVDLTIGAFITRDDQNTNILFREIDK